MITNTGKNIIAKYLLGQAPAYASHIAIGCGKKPLQTSESLAPYQAEFAYKDSLDFEMFRVPVISRGYITEEDPQALSISSVVALTQPNAGQVEYTTTSVHGLSPGDIVDISGTDIPVYNIPNAIIFSTPSPTKFRVQSGATGSYSSGGTVIKRISKLVLTAELPTEQRYEITEVGLYSAGSNPSATDKDSRMLYTFAETENWEYHGTGSAIGIGSTISTPLSAGASAGVINPNLGPAPAFRATSDNAIFDSEARLSKYERCRFLNTAIYVPGNMSQLVKVSLGGGKEDLVVKSGTEDEEKEFAKHIHLAGTRLNLSQNSPEDEIRLAFSIIRKDQSYLPDPTKAYIAVTFGPEESILEDPENYARFNIQLTSGFGVSRYNVVSSKLGDLVRGTTFSWGAVRLAKIHASVYNSATVTNRSFVSSTGVATITTAGPHGYAAGNSVTISGVNSALFNGTFTVTGVPSPTTFTFAAVNAEDITSALSGGIAEGPSSNYFVGLDALRLENVSTLNPLYGLTGYTVIKTDDARPIVKAANTSNLVEFRFGLDVM
jgi:hypothetical protein